MLPPHGAGYGGGWWTQLNPTVTVLADGRMPVAEQSYLVEGDILKVIVNLRGTAIPAGGSGAETL